MIRARGLTKYYANGGETIRALEAVDLSLEEGAFATVSEIAYRIGFTKPGYFSAVYQKRFGRLPSSYLESRSLN